MKFILTALLLAGLQEESGEIARRLEPALRQELDRLRGELLSVVREEFEEARAEEIPEHVAAETVRADVEFLASDELEGREAGYPGADRAAEYIAGVFQEAGLEPAGDGGTFFQEFPVRDRKTRNCLGLIRGDDPESGGEVVVLGAHYDHVGMEGQHDLGRLGGPKDGDRIWNGADDNASGVAALLGIARALGGSDRPVRRTILFISFGGEEAGLLGSRHYVEHPSVSPIERHVFMINLDMVGRNPDRPVDVYGVGSAEGDLLERATESAFRRGGLEARLHAGRLVAGSDSDHGSFIARGVPSVFFFTGLHPDYHRATDHADRLDYDHLAGVADAALRLALRFADSDSRLVFHRN